jgi:hypothetical protein
MLTPWVRRPEPAGKGENLMRTMLRVQMGNEAASRAIQDGSLPATMQKLTAMLHPEAAYFTSCDGLRTAYFVFDMTDSAQLPPIAEPLFSTLDAKIDVSPVMNADDLTKGLSQLAG